MVQIDWQLRKPSHLVFHSCDPKVLVKSQSSRLLYLICSTLIRLASLKLVIAANSFTNSFIFSLSEHYLTFSNSTLTLKCVQVVLCNAPWCVFFTKRSHILKQTWSWRLQVCLSLCDVSVDNSYNIYQKVFCSHHNLFRTLITCIYVIIHLSVCLIETLRCRSPHFMQRQFRRWNPKF